MGRPRVVMMATGAWYDPLEPGVPGSLDRHGNANMLTLDKGSSKLGQATIAETCLVEVEPYEGELPAITVSDPPPVVIASLRGRGDPPARPAPCQTPRPPQDHRKRAEPHDHRHKTRKAQHRAR